MLLKDFLGEMTMKAGDLSSPLKKSFDYFSKEITDDELTHIGDIDSIKVMRFELSKSKKTYNQGVPQILDFLVDGETKIGMMFGDKKRVSTNSRLWKDGPRFILEIKEWVIFKPRSGLGEKYLYFLKNVMKTPLLLSNMHSIATQEFLKKHANLKRFSLSWYNVKSGEIEKFEDSKYSISEPTDWQVLIESDNTSVFEQYRIGAPSIRNDYSWLFDSIEKL
jgi:hypothetical protein